MGQAIVRAGRDSPWYLVWSSISDSVLAVGTRAEAVQWAVDEWGMPPARAEEAMVRCDELGSTDRAIGFGRWDDEFLAVVTTAPGDGWYHLRRDRLEAYARALYDGDEAAAVALLECWQRHDDLDG